MFQVLCLHVLRRTINAGEFLPLKEITSFKSKNTLPSPVQTAGIFLKHTCDRISSSCREGPSSRRLAGTLLLGAWPPFTPRPPSAFQRQVPHTSSAAGNAALPPFFPLSTLSTHNSIKNSRPIFWSEKTFPDTTFSFLDEVSAPAHVTECSSIGLIKLLKE